MWLSLTRVGVAITPRIYQIDLELRVMISISCTTLDKDRWSLACGAEEGR